MGWEVANGVGGGQWDGGWRATIKAEPSSNDALLSLTLPK